MNIERRNTREPNGLARGKQDLDLAKQVVSDSYDCLFTAVHSKSGSTTGAGAHEGLGSSPKRQHASVYRYERSVIVDTSAGFSRAGRKIFTAVQISFF